MAVKSNQENPANGHSDLHGAAAILFLQLVAIHPSPFFDVQPRSCSASVQTHWDPIGLFFAGAWFLFTVAFEHTCFYRRTRNIFLCGAYSIFAAWNALMIHKNSQEAWRNTVLRCVLPSVTTAVAHKTPDPALLARLVSHVIIFSAVLLPTAGLTVALLRIPILISSTVSAGLLAVNWNRAKAAEMVVGEGVESRNGVLEGVTERKDAVRRKEDSSLGDQTPVPNVRDATTGSEKKEADCNSGGAELSHRKVDRYASQKEPAVPGRLLENAGHSLEPGPSGQAMNAYQTDERKDHSGEAGGRVEGALGARLEDATAFGSSRGRVKRQRGKKRVEEKTRRRAPAEVAIVMGAEVSRLVSVSKVMEIGDAQEFLMRAQIIMSDAAVRASQEVARYDTRTAKPISYPEETDLEAPFRGSESANTPGTSEFSDPPVASGSGRPPLPPPRQSPRGDPPNDQMLDRGQIPDSIHGRWERESACVSESLHERPDRATSSQSVHGSESLHDRTEQGEGARVSENLYERAERCVNRLGYEWAALKWEESQVEVKALGALKEAVLGGKGEEDLLRAINLVRDARRGLAMLGTASCRSQPWHALERRGCRAGLLFGPLWVTPLLAKDAGRAAWVAQACGTEGLVGESVVKVYPQLGMSQAQALAATCRDMERVETQLEAELTKLRTAIRPWLRGRLVDPPSVTGLVLGNLGDEVEQLAIQADELQLQLFEHCKQILTPLQMGTLLLALMDQRMRLQRLGSFWESVAAGQDVMTGVRKLTGRMANFNA